MGVSKTLELQWGWAVLAGGEPRAPKTGVCGGLSRRLRSVLTEHIGLLCGILSRTLPFSGAASGIEATMRNLLCGLRWNDC